MGQDVGYWPKDKIDLNSNELMEINVRDAIKEQEKGRKRVQFLKIDVLCKSFGGLTAIHKVDFQLRKTKLSVSSVPMDQGRPRY